MATSRYQPALLGGLFIGVLSSIPLVSAANVCCCLWVVAGGVLTVYLQQQRAAAPVEASEAVLGGLIAGLIGAVITVAASFVLLSLMGPMWTSSLQSALENPDMPPQAREWMARLMTGQGIVAFQLLVYVPCYAIFGMLGALLGLAIFKKKTPPAATTTA